MEMTEAQKKTISGGIYLVIDPSMALNVLLPKLDAAIAGGVQVVQIWNNWPDESNKLLLVTAIAERCKPRAIPLLINEEWHLLTETTDLDGVHFDSEPADILSIKKSVNRPIIMGITCSGDLDTVRWADENELDYISFCSMFPSASAGSCDLVMPETVQTAKNLTQIPLFVSGGITPQNALILKQQIPFDGIAVISGLLNADDPKTQAQAYLTALNS
ncbi:thiamine phosphate synthase [Pedobacter endophyticus]|uniref:Thiamine phosphate synthase n=1 Tax=Pedobacter endophyticus TaxID=2789740 RepID=A0A7S9L1D9_9SPHI|nr:thiamine phosphate synthase [Pedobacter endophyticus]QPH40705.1 thiamine phosphate synthase [Pedobacter endophyticus]